MYNEKEEVEDKGKEWSFYVAGVKFHDAYKCIDRMKVGDKLQMIAEPENKFDPNAIRLEFEDIMIGYVKGKISAEVSAATMYGRLDCSIIELNLEAKPWESIKVKITEVV